MTETLTSTKENIKSSIPYTKIENVYIQSFALADIFRDILESKEIFREEFLWFLEWFMSENNSTDEDIVGAEYYNDTFFIDTKNSGKISFSLSSLLEYSAQDMLNGISIKEQETKTHNLLEAIDSIYKANQWILYNWEINNQDVLSDDRFWIQLQWKTLQELRELYEVEISLLSQVYDITQETDKKEALLKKEIQFFAGLWDKYEWWARYFSLSQDEIWSKVSKLIENMSLKEVFQYMRETHSIIDSNWRKSDMVNQVNWKLIDELNTQVFSRLQQENAPDEEVLEFAKIITGRWEIWSIDNKYKSPELANRVLIYVMHRDNGVLDDILTNNSEIEHQVVDPELKWLTPSKIIGNIVWEINSLAPNTPNYGEDFIKQSGYGHLLKNKSWYWDLSFEDKIAIWALKRMYDVLKETPAQEKTPEILQKKLSQQLEKSYNTLNASFWDAFDWYNWYFWWETASSLWLKWTFGEVFDLYQDINGNSWFFDWSDTNKDKILNLSTATILWVSLIVWAIVFSPVIAAWTTATAGMMLMAWAKAGLATGLLSVGLSRQWYDTYTEGAMDVSSQILVDTAAWAIFALGWLTAIKYLKVKWLTQQYKWLKTMPKLQNYMVYNAPSNLWSDLLFSRQAWSWIWGLDKWVILWEVGAVGFIVSPATSKFVRNYFQESHHDTDIEDFNN